MLEKIKRFLNERAIWLAYGAPIRSPERIKELFNTCSDCEFFDAKKDGVGICRECGCGLKKEGNNLNKLAWGTTHCPLNPPKWEEEPNLVLVEINEEAKAFIETEEKDILAKQKVMEAMETQKQIQAPKKKGGCGCGG